MLLKFVVLVLFALVRGDVLNRQRRYLIFTPATQYGIFATVSVPLPEPNNLVNMAWFFEAQYFNVDNSTWFEPLLGDIEISKSRERRRAKQQMQININRVLVYTLIESMLNTYGFEGRSCLLRSICETSTSHFSHNGLLGDLLHLILTPSSSMEEEDLSDWYYEAEYRGLVGDCGRYLQDCISSPLDDVSMFIDH